MIRHAPAQHGGRLAGRRDVAADCGDTHTLAWLRAQVMAAGARVVTSPARRCVQTAAAMGYAGAPTDARLWEQDFGVWEGLDIDALPDLGPLPLPALAAHRPQGGESFDDMAARIAPVLRAQQGPVALIAHAGTVRAGLSLAVGAAALRFAVAPLSLTVMTRMGGEWAVEAVNNRAPGSDG